MPSGMLKHNQLKKNYFFASLTYANLDLKITFLRLFSAILLKIAYNYPFKFFLSLFKHANLCKSKCGFEKLRVRGFGIIPKINTNSMSRASLIYANLDLKTFFLCVAIFSHFAENLIVFPLSLQKCRFM